VTGDAREQAVDWAGLFDRLAPSYDQSGVPFFGPIAAGLLGQLRPRTGEHALDVGAGRGALTLPLAKAVGPTGRVDAVDISTRMVELTAHAAEAHGFRHVRVQAGDAGGPGLPRGPYDLVGSSLVLFFLPRPVEALHEWFSRLRAGGRLGVSTFRPWSPSWQAIEDVFSEYVPPSDGPGPTAMPEAFATDEGVERLFREAGARSVRTVGATYAIPFDGVDQWREWSFGTAVRGLWMLAPEEAHPEILRRVEELLDLLRGADGRSRIDFDLRYTLGSP
jgi:ubiquinone/menaquinone biosynthesis C-methylase UbiE